MMKINDKNFATSKTCENLMRAFAGESQARNRYTFAADQAHTASMPMIERVFRFTAEQEKEHAEIFYDFLADLSGETIYIDGGYPVNISEDLGQLIKWAEHNEMEEYAVVYADFAKVAAAEGYREIAGRFALIAEIEKYHSERFKNLGELLANDELFQSRENTKWVCLNCGHIYSGTKLPDKCPVCEHTKGYFIQAEYSPYNFGQI